MVEVRSIVNSRLGFWALATLAIGVSSVLYRLAFARFSFHLTLWLGLAPLFVLLLFCARAQSRPVGKAGLAGFLFGWLTAVLTGHWVYEAMVVYGHSAPSTAIFFIGGVMGTYLGLWYGACFALGAYLLRPFARKLFWLAAASHRKPDAGQPLLIIHIALTVAGLWVGTEYLRSTVGLQIPWALVGHSQLENRLVIQGADLFGAYGLSGLIVFINGVGAQWVALVVYRAYVHPKGSANSRLGLTATSTLFGPALASCAGLIFLVMVYGLLRQPNGDASQKQGQKQLAVVQASIDQSRRWKKEYYADNLRQYVDLSRHAVKQGTQMIVWAETSVQGYLQDTIPPALAEFMNDYPDVVLITGGPRYAGTREKPRFYNSVFVLKNGGIVDTYDKMELLPFGEYFPLRGLSFLARRFAAPTEYTPGEMQKVFRWGQSASTSTSASTSASASASASIGGLRPWSALICYESIFPAVLRQAANKGARWFLNVSNDAWFGGGHGPFQHLDMARFSAVAFRRPIIRSANTGISAIIDAHGRVVDRLDLFKKEIMMVSVPTTKLTSAYARWGDILPAILGLYLFIVLLSRIFIRPLRRAAGGGLFKGIR